MNELKKTFYLLGVTALIVALMKYASFLLIPLTFGILIAILLDPMVRWLRKYIKYHIPAYIISLTSMIVLLGFPTYAISTTIYKIFSKSEENTQAAKESIDKFVGNIEQIFTNSFLNPQDFEEILSKLFTYLQELVGFFVFDSITAITNIMLSILFSYFLHAYFSKTKKMVIKSSDPAAKNRLRNLINRIPGVLRSYVFGTAIVVVILGVMSSVFLYIIGLKYAVLWGAIIGILAIIPYVGSVLGILLPMTYSMIQNQSLPELLIIAMGSIVIQIIEGNFITPKIVGDKVGLNPFIIILWMLVLGKIWGIAGVMLTIPIVSVTRVILEEYDKELLSKLFFESRD